MNIVNDEVVEVWREIDGFDGYQVSNLGTVRSLDRWAEYSNKRSRIHKGQVLKPQLVNRGYYCVLLYRANKTRRKCCVHVLVAKAFIPNPVNKPEVNHIDGIKTHNAFFNLEWNTHRENTQHAYDTGLAARGSKHSRSKLSELDVYSVRERYAKSETIAAIAREFNVGETTIRHIIRGKNWNHLI